MQRRMTSSAECCPGYIKPEIPKVAELIVHIIAEQVQEEHVEYDMPGISMQKSIGHKLPPRWIPGDKLKLLSPWSQRL
jgi:hypothetical protein